MVVRKIGNATLYLGDSLDILPTLGHVDHLICDPPYESAIHHYKTTKRKSNLRTDAGPELAALNFDSVEAIRQPFIDIASQCCKGWLLAFCTPEGVGRWADVINASPIRYKRACVWVKPDATPQFNGQGPAMGAEMFVAAWAGGGYAKWNGGGKRGVYTHNTKNKTRTGKHPTEKPLNLMIDLIADFTMLGQVVCDPFMGVGTTGLAAVRTGRHFIGIEKDPAYFEAACERLCDEQTQLELSF